MIINKEKFYSKACVKKVACDFDVYCTIFPFYLLLYLLILAQ